MYLIIMGTKMTLDKCQYNHTYKVAAINLNNAAIKEDKGIFDYESLCNICKEIFVI